MPESDEELVVSTDAVTSEPSTSADIRGSPNEEIDVENVIVVKEKILGNETQKNWRAKKREEGGSVKNFLN